MCTRHISWRDTITNISEYYISVSVIWFKYDFRWTKIVPWRHKLHSNYKHTAMPQVWLLSFSFNTWTIPILILNHTFNYKIFRTFISFFTRNLLICSALREKILIYEILKTQQPYFNLLFSFENWPLCNSYLQRWICKFYYYSKHISSAGKQSIYFSLTIQPIISLSIQLAA